MVLLADQDRSRWDAVSIARTCRELDRLAGRADVELGGPGPYLLQAAIAACHARAPSFEATDWDGILALYDRLLATWPSPVVALNRAVALGMARGPAEALPLVEALAEEGALAGYASLETARADCLRRLGRLAEARDAYEAARVRAGSAPERQLLAELRDACVATARET